MTNADFFEREIEKIEIFDLREFTRFFFNNCTGAWFFESGASSNGKYHPEFAKGAGGLVRHTRAVFWVCEELLRMDTYSYMKKEYKDYARMACLLHDVCKYGNGDEMNKDYYATHGEFAAIIVEDAWNEYFNIPCPDFLLSAIRSHMGQWTADKENRPITDIDHLVHLSDYIASRPFWDIPQITAEYNKDFDRLLKETFETDLPFQEAVFISRRANFY